MYFLAAVQKSSAQVLIQALADHFWNARGEGDQDDRDDRDDRIVHPGADQAEFHLVEHRCWVGGGVHGDLADAKAWNPVQHDQHDQHDQDAQAVLISGCPRDGWVERVFHPVAAQAAQVAAPVRVSVEAVSAPAQEPPAWL